MKTEAFVLREIGTPMQLESVQLDPPQRNEVLVRITAAGLCRSDLHVINGDDRLPLPIVLGHEAVGVVEQVGDFVDHLQIGQRVILSWTPPCESCRPCRNNRPALCESAAQAYASGQLPGGGTRLRSQDQQPIYHYSSVASYARHAVVPASGCIPIHANTIKDEAAAGIGCAVITGIGAVINTARVRCGESVAVFGLGGVGLNVVQGAKLCGAGVIIGIDTNAATRALAQQFGTTHFINARGKDSQEVVAEINQICDGGVDVAFDALGNINLIHNATKATASGGRIICVGLAPSGEMASFDANALVCDGKMIAGSYYGGTIAKRDFAMLVDLAQHGRILLDELVTEIIPFADIADGLKRMQDGKLTGRLVARMD